MKEESDIMESIPEDERMAADSKLIATWKNPEVRSQFRCQLLGEVFPHHSSPGLVSILHASTEPCAVPTTNTDLTELWLFGSRPVSAITTVSSIREKNIPVFTFLFVVPNTEPGSKEVLIRYLLNKLVNVQVKLGLKNPSPFFLRGRHPEVI